MGFPLNSPANDVYFVCSAGGDSGYFASNRRAERALTDAVCCNDLYAFRLESKRMEVCSDTVWCPLEEKCPTEASRKALSMLPLTLYFHNDEPDARSESDTTEMDYQSSLALYLAMFPIYREAYAAGLQETAADSAREQIRVFFSDSLERGYRRLRAFFALLREDLENGSSVSLTVEGHASPLFSDNYNMHLSSRRICSMWNSLVAYEGGFFQPYIRSGQLQFIQDPRGRRQAKPYVSDNPNDLRNSVYSVAAALERRIRIVGYNVVPAASGGFTACLQLPATRFVWKRRPGTDRYLYRIEVRNVCEDTVRLEFVSETSDVCCGADAVALLPHGSTFLTVAFGDALFGTQPERHAVLRLSRNGQSEELPLSFVFFKQK
jgi:hypothetical protein